MSTPRTPQPGDLLILPDGREFVLDAATDGTGVRGWWFKAHASDNARTLQGNLKLDWDARAQTWRPAGERPAAPAPAAPAPQAPRAARVNSPQRQKQLD